MTDELDVANYRPKLEVAAAAEHASWSGWMHYMLPSIEKEFLENAKTDDELTKAFARFNGLSCVKRWIRQSNTDYFDLPQNERISDRVEVLKKLDAYRELVNSALEGGRL